MIIALSSRFVPLLGCGACKGFQGEERVIVPAQCRSVQLSCPAATAAAAPRNVPAVVRQRWLRAGFLRDGCQGARGAPEAGWAGWEVPWELQG